MTLQEKPSPTLILKDPSRRTLKQDLIDLVSILEITTAVRYGQWSDLDPSVPEINDCLVTGYLAYFNQHGRRVGGDPLMWVFEKQELFIPVMSAFAEADLMVLTPSDRLPDPLPGYLGYGSAFLILAHTYLRNVPYFVTAAYDWVGYYVVYADEAARLQVRGKLAAHFGDRSHDIASTQLHRLM